MDRPGTVTGLALVLVGHALLAGTLALAALSFVLVTALAQLGPSAAGGPPPDGATAGPARMRLGARPAAATAATAGPVAEASPGPPARAFTPFWVRNYRAAEMWSGPAESGGVSFGTTSAPFCSFLVVLPQDDARLYVFNPFSENYFWIDAEGVGPVGVPERRPGPKPADQNCAGAVHEQ